MYHNANIMLRVKTKLGVSSIEGIGLFADQFIPQGTETWVYDPEFDVSFSEEQLSALPDYQKNALLHYLYFDKDLNKYVLCADNQRFINHTTKETNIESTPRKDVAKKDIQMGEELLCDYFKFDDSYFDRIGLPKENLK